MTERRQQCPSCRHFYVHPRICRRCYVHTVDWMAKLGPHVDRMIEGRRRRIVTQK